MVEKLSIADKIKAGPYPGLRSFQYNEAHLFFGRDEQVDKLLEKIQNSHFVAVIGPSGCGKSSLVKAGLVPALKTGFIIEAGSKWRIAEMRPGDKPFYNLSQALLKSFKNEDTAPECIKAELKRNPKSLVEVIKSEKLDKRENFLLIVDQFEELFRYRQNNNIDEVTAFIALLIASVTQQDVSIHIVITMRSDFLGDCSLFIGLPEILNDNQFLTPRLTREQTKEAIEGPALVCGGNLEPQLVNTLLNDIGVDHDQLPLLQHALMRMWTLDKTIETHKKDDSSDAGVHLLASNQFTLTIDEYIEIGRLSNALSRHANQIYDKQLSAAQKGIAEVLFKRLSERNMEQKDIRRPCTVQDIADVARVSTEEVIAVANLFRAAGNDFLTPPADVELTPDSYLDISHESVIRQWDKMKVWIAQEYKDATLFKRLIADSDDHLIDKGELLSGSDAYNMAHWKNNKNINTAWAIRYSDKLPQVKKYIDDSKIKEKRKKTLRFSIGGIVATLIIAIILVTVNSSFKEKESQAQELVNELKIQEAKKNIEIQTAYTAGLELQKKEVENQNEQIKGQLEDIQKQKSKIEKQKSEIERINSELIANNGKLNKQNEELKRKDYISQIKEQYFYSKLDSNNKILAIKELLPLYFAGNEIRLQQAIDTINLLIQIKANTYQEPMENFRKGKKIWETNKRPIVRSLLTGIINENIFYKQEIIPAFKYSYLNNYVNLVPDKGSFAINNGYDEIVLGKYQHDSLVVREQYQSGDSSSSSFDEPLLTAGFYNDHIIGLNTERKLFEWNRFGRKFIDSFSTMDRYDRFEFSPDGRFLISMPPLNSASNLKINNKINAAEDRAIKLWSIANIKNKNPKATILDSSQSGIKQMVFSPDSKQVLFLHTDGKLKLFKTWDNKKHVDIKYTAKPTAVNFSPSGNYVISITSLGNADVWDTSQGYRANFQTVKLPGVFFNKVNDFAISPDWKKMLVMREDSLTLYERANGDSIFYRINDSTKLSSENEFVKRKFGGSRYISKAAFLSNNSIITANEYGNIHLWKIYPVFHNPDEAFATIQTPSLSLAEKLATDSVYLVQLLNKLDIGELDSIAGILSATAAHQTEYHKSLENLNISKKIIKKLVEKSVTNNSKDYYLEKIFLINKQLIEIEELEANPNYQLLVQQYKENTELGEKQLKPNINDTSLKETLSRSYWNLSWYQLLNSDFKGAIRSANRGLTLYPKNDGIKTNLALGYLLSNQFSDAEIIYRENKGKSYANRLTKFTDAFLQDFSDLEAKEIISSKNAVLHEQVRKIKGMLQQK